MPSGWFSWQFGSEATQVALGEGRHLLIWSWAGYVANREEIFSLATIIAGAIGIPLLIIRTRAVNRSAKAADIQARTAEQGHITDRFTRAVEQLGSDKLPIRIGAIYALERISKDSPRDYWSIMEILTAYVREYAPWPARQNVVDSPKNENSRASESHTKKIFQKTGEAATK